MKKDRAKLEDNLNLILQDYSNDSKVIEAVTADLAAKGIPRGKVGGLFTQAIDLSYIPEIELCLFAKYLYSHTHEFKINPDIFFNEVELSTAELYHYNEKEKTRTMLLHNVDQISDHQYLCSKETYQGVGRHYGNALWGYNPNVQRQPLKRKVGDRIIEVININKKKISEIKTEMIKGTFNTNAIILNVRRINGMEKIKYNAKDRTLMVEVDETTSIDLIDGMHRVGAMLKVVEEKPEIDRLTSIYIYHVDEEKARSIIKQESKSTPIDEEWIDFIDASNANMEVVKSISSRERMNELFNRMALDNLEIRRENKLVTFETMSKVIEYVYDLNDKNKPVIQAQQVEKFLVEAFNIIIGANHDSFNDKLSEARESSYVADNNMFIGYVILSEEVKKIYGEDWQDALYQIVSKLDFNRSNPIWKKIGIENNVNLPTIKKIDEYFKKLVGQGGVVSNVL